MNADTLQLTLFILTIASGSLLWVLEGIFPFFQGRMQRWRHAIPNLAVALLNTGLSSLLVGATLWELSHLQPYWQGLRAWLSDWQAAVLLVVCYDFWMYLWHRLNHQLPLLWQFHKFHHRDTQMDVTTGVRFHPVELFLSEVLRFPILFLLGMTATDLLLYNLLSLPIILLHHSNFALPGWLDRALSLVVPSPNLHRQHHSLRKVEADTNYGTLLSLWDRLLGSLQYPSAPHALRLGIEEN